MNDNYTYGLNWDYGGETWLPVFFNDCDTNGTHAELLDVIQFNLKYYPEREFQVWIAPKTNIDDKMYYKVCRALSVEGAREFDVWASTRAKLLGVE